MASLRRSLLWIFAFSAMFSSCIKEDDLQFDKITESEWDPEFAIPLIYSSSSIADLISTNSDLFQTDTSHLISLVYKTDLYSSPNMPLVNIPAFGYPDLINLSRSDSSFLYNYGTVTKNVNRSIPVIIPGNDVIDSLRVKTGSLRVRLNSDIQHSGTFNIRLPYVKRNGQTFSRNIPFTIVNGLPAIADTTFDLSGWNINLNNNGSYQIDVNMSSTFGNSGSTQSLTNRRMTVNIDFSSIESSTVYGQMDRISFTIPSDTVNLPVFNTVQSGSIFLDDPQLTFTFDNSFGLPVDAFINGLYAETGNGNLLPVTGFTNPLPVQSPTVAGQNAVSSIRLDKNNSNIRTILNQSPTKIIYDLSANLTSSPGQVNFMLDTSRIKISADIKIPLKGYADNLTIQDTVEFGLGNIKEIDQAEFKINILNGFPTNATVQAYFTDSAYTVLDSLLTNGTNIVESAAVDNNGRAISSTRKTTIEAYNNSRIQNITNAKKILIRASINTHDAPNSMVEFYDYYKIDFKVGAKVKMKVGL